MSQEQENSEDINKLLDGLLNSYKSNSDYTLKERFEHRLNELQISQRQALEILQIERKSLLGVLDGTISRLDFLTLIKLADFIGIKHSDVYQLFINGLSTSIKSQLSETEKRNFIINNFDLASLKKSGFIDSIADFDHIEKRIVDFFGYDTIYDYKKERINAAFSSVRQQQENKIRGFWVEAAYQHLKKINNFYEYDRQALIDYFPSIRWQSTNVENGLFQVIRSLFKLGITVIYQPYLTNLQARGATIAVNKKPCIVLTDYKKFYPTLWFALIHELHHVLFDWEEIKINSYHISGEADLFIDKEQEADTFARQYLFNDAKMQEILPHISDEYFINNFARTYHIHPSIIYIYYCYDKGAENKSVWAKFRRHMPEIKDCIKSLSKNPWQKTIKEIIKLEQEKISYPISV